MIGEQAKNEFHQKIQQEHDELRELLGKIHRLLAERVVTPAHVGNSISSLCEHVESHFADEENDGFFDEISTQAPRLSDRAKAVCEEHVWLLTTIRGLNLAAQEGDGSSKWWQQLADDFHQFSKDLMHHESKEVELLQEAYIEDIGAAD